MSKMQRTDKNGNTLHVIGVQDDCRKRSSFFDVRNIAGRRMIRDDFYEQNENLY